MCLQQGCSQCHTTCVKTTKNHRNQPQPRHKYKTVDVDSPFEFAYFFVIMYTCVYLIGSNFLYLPTVYNLPFVTGGNECFIS